jgi:hypothetical protein
MANDGVAQLPALAAAPASNSRIDVLYFKQNENGYNGLADGLITPTFGVITGVAAASPVKPSIAGIAGAVELATITIPSTATATNSSGVVITNTFQYTTCTGGALWLRNLTEEAAWSPANGSMAWRIDKGWLATRKGGAWVPVSGEQHAEFTTSSIAGNAAQFGVGTVTLDSAASTDSSFVAPIADGIRLGAGTYAINVAGNLTAAATGRSYVGIENAVGTVFHARSGIPAGENIFSVSTPNLRVTATTDVIFSLFQTTGATRTIATRVKVTRVA